MKESQVHKIWLEKLWKVENHSTSCGKKLRILSPGTLNPDAGPDFFNVLVRIDGLLWAGNVEVHGRSSDWFRHGHHRDAAYNNVVLHLVLEDDTRVWDSKGRQIPNLLIGPDLSGKDKTESSPPAAIIRCLPGAAELDREIWERWLLELFRARIETKKQQFLSQSHAQDRDWEKILYSILGKGFGLPINVLPFRMTLSRLPREVLLRYRDDCFDLEALLFGQAGLLPESDCGPYGNFLNERFESLRTILPQPPLETYLWKFLRLRPASFPTLRISQFASLIHQHSPLLPTLLEQKNPSEVEALFNLSSSAYWNMHYRFDQASPDMEKSLGKQARETLLINTLVPFLLSYGRESGNKEAGTLGEALLAATAAEANRITREWNENGIRAKNAMESQALIHLYNNYCKQNRCSDCLLGKLCLLQNGP